MCGIVGILTSYQNGFSQKELSFFEEMLYVDALRGLDSTGAFTVKNSGNFQWAKGAVSPSAFLRNNEWNILKAAAMGTGTFIFGHNRKATEGSINNKNAHPFVENDTILIHNGSLQNWRSLMRVEKRDKLGIEVDSHLVTYLFAHENYVDVLKEIEGAYVFVWYSAKEKMLRIAKNIERPFHFGHEEKSGAIVFSSEQGIMRMVLNRRHDCEIKKVDALKEGFVYGYELQKNGKPKMIEETPIVKKFFVGSANEWYKRRYLAEDSKGAALPQLEEVKPVTPNTPAVVPTPAQTPPANPGGNKVLKLAKVVGEVGTMSSLPNNHQYIPEQYRHNIYYGNRDLADYSIRPYERCLFMIDDYQAVAGSNNHWTFQGVLVAHPEKLVRGFYNGEEADLIKMSGDAVVGYLQRATLVGGEGVKPHWVLSVRHPVPAQIVEVADGEFMEKEDFLHKVKECRGNCFCQKEIKNMRTTEIAIPDPNRDGDEIFCKACVGPAANKQ